MEKKKERKIVGQELLWLYRVLFTTNHKSWFSSREGRGAYGETKKAGDSPAQLGNRGAALILQCRTCGKTGGLWTAMCLLEDTRESGLNDLYRPFGPTIRVFAVTGLNKGFGCVHLVNKEDARREPSTISWIWL
ncbi:hypothetical protein H0E87_019835 [Populus deltoides]|uniref:RRM domain-containing protein n=1 Tax=Populus deltoides TaxID=3696 RepID=A0A8T2XWT7_POPDE|nr:hypothetical protein H0E87_019835 [Populus deltoides]